MTTTTMRVIFVAIISGSIVSFGCWGTAIAGICPPNDRLVSLPQGPACVRRSTERVPVRQENRQRQYNVSRTRQGQCVYPRRLVRFSRGVACLSPGQIAILKRRLASLRQHQRQNAGGGMQVSMPSNGQKKSGGGMQVFMPAKMKVSKPSEMQRFVPAKMKMFRPSKMHMFVPSKMKMFRPSKMPVFVPSKMKVSKPGKMHIVGPPGKAPAQASSGGKSGTAGYNQAQAYWGSVMSQDIMNEGLSGSGMQWESR